MMVSVLQLSTTTCVHANMVTAVSDATTVSFHVFPVGQLNAFQKQFKTEVFILVFFISDLILFNQLYSSKKF